MNKLFRLLLILILVPSYAGCQPAATSQPVPASQFIAPTKTSRVSESKTTTPAPRLAPTATTVTPAAPYELISEASLLSYLKDLTAIQPYSGWRNSGSSGEAEARAYVAQKLAGFSNLHRAGLEVERQTVSVYMATEIWDSRLFLTVDEKEIEVPADGIRGSKGQRSMAAAFDSDGVSGDTDQDPLTATGAPILVQEDDRLYSLKVDEIQGRIIFVDYSLVDPILNEDAPLNSSQLTSLVDRGLAGVVLVTQYSNHAGESRGSMIGDGGGFNWGVPTRHVPVLYVRLEDLSPAGVSTWDDLQRVEAVRMLLDSDVLSPAQAGNVIARIPGTDSSKAVILGAHIDSPNSPGGFDNGSGSAALLEIARVLDISQIRPPVDIYLAWFGAHEIGTYGSAHFAVTHQDLLDRTLAMIQMDCLGYPLDSRPSAMTMMLTSYGRFGDERLLLPDYLSQAVAPQGLSLETWVEYGLTADNANFDAFNVPNLVLLNMNANELRTKGWSYMHYSNHYHDPYETLDLVREVGDEFVGMTKVLLAAAFEIGRAQPNLRVAPAATERALFVSSHTEPSNVPTAMLRELGMALAWEGFDVDLLPYGQAITAADLKDVGVVVLLPTLDFSGQPPAQWSEAELALLAEYVSNGGLLVVANSACNYISKRCIDDTNEDKRMLNSFFEPMGFKFTLAGGLDAEVALAVTEHPLTKDASYLGLYRGEGVAFRLQNGLELYQVGGHPIAGLVDFGDQGGQVLVIGDLGLLQGDHHGAKNMEFLQNIAHYARTR